MSENRRHPRLGLLLPFKVKALECEVHEVSISGIRFFTEEPLPPDSVKEMSLEVGEDETLKVTAAIRWCRPSATGGYEVGAEICPPEGEA